MNKDLKQDEDDAININEIRSDEMQEIISSVPRWILRWGITVVFIILLGIILLSAIIDYPDVVRAELKINSLNSPKAVLAKQSGKLISILVDDGQQIGKNQPLAYFESIGDHQDILELNIRLKKIKKQFLSDSSHQLSLGSDLNLGELQGDFQTFHQQYRQYIATLDRGYYFNRLWYLEKDINQLKKLEHALQKQKLIQEQEFGNQEIEYHAYQKLYKNKVISRSEFSHQENIFLSSKFPLQQTEISILNNTNSKVLKDKEIMELKNAIDEEKSKFLQAVNKMITSSDNWISQFVLKSPINGKVSFAGIIQLNQNLTIGQEVFVVDPGNQVFFGEIRIPQLNMGKLRMGERTLVKLRSYPFEQYGVIYGKLTYISDVAFRDSLFIAKVTFDKIDHKEKDVKFILKNGMVADAEIITEESSLLQRFFSNFRKIFNGRTY